MTTADRFLLADLTWPEAAARRLLSPLVIVPTGACEQHGPALSLDTDTVRASEVAFRLAGRLAPAALVAPTLPFGVSEHHMAFSGTVSLDPITFQQVLYEVVSSLHRHGWRHVLVLNGHGGNSAAIAVALQRLQTDIPSLLVASAGITNVVRDLAKELAVSDVYGHSCEIETSQLMALAPGKVRTGQLRRGASDRGDLGPLGTLSRNGHDIQFPQPFHRLTASGALGDATSASPAAGWELIDKAVARLAAFLEEFVGAEAPTPEPAPQIPIGGGA